MDERFSSPLGQHGRQMHSNEKNVLKEVQHSSKGTTDDHIEVISIIRTVFLFEESQGLQNTLHFSQLGWRRSSVVRTSVFGRQTFPDLCPIYG